MSAKLGDGLLVATHRLLETRLLIQANSGGGKSYAIRKLVEETYGECQQIILDVEGEFSSLREKFDFIIAGKDHDIPAEPRSAELLARKILELGTSLIVDLYELKHHERIRFVKNFLDAMINAPKDLWHPVMVVLDEAHLFAPEKGQSEAMQAVTDLATRGRKRGFCAVLATQRLSKLNKDVAAELGNKLIGRTGLDIDMKRAADELGFTGKEQLMSLRKLKPGEFYAFGPAICDEVIKFQVGRVSTNHPHLGARKMRIPPTTEKIKAVLAKLVDLPKEAEEEIKDRERLRLKVRELENKLRQVPKAEPTDEQKNRWIQTGRSSAVKEVQAALPAVFKLNLALSKALEKLSETVLTSGFNKIKEEIEQQEASINKIGKAMVELEGHMNKHVNNVHPPDWKPGPPPKPPISSLLGRVGSVSNFLGLGRCERAILGFLQTRSPYWFTKVQVGAMTGYAHSSGGFNNAVSRLIQHGIIQRNSSGQLSATVEGMKVDVGQDTPHRLEDWVNKLGACERAIYHLLVQNPEAELDKDDLAHETGYSAGSGGFNNAISRLNTLGLIRRQNGQIALNRESFCME